MYTYLDISAFSECFLPLVESDLVQTINSNILYKMCMHTEAKLSYDYLMRNVFNKITPVGRQILYLSADQHAKFMSDDYRPTVCLNLIEAYRSRIFNTGQCLVNSEN